MAHKKSFSSRSSKPRGLFINQAKAQCSIFESGWMAYSCLRQSDQYTLDYKEITPTSTQIGAYDFYVLNYHHATMSWLNTNSIRQLPGKKFTLVLETLPGNPFALCPSDLFDAYIALDPTMDRPDDNRVYAFPRPLESAPVLPPFREPEGPVIGTFGFATPGKGFERVVDAVNREFKQAIVRINIPSATFCDGVTFALHRTNYAGYLADLCRSVAAPGIQIQVTNDFLSKEQLIRWCSENTLNCFLYHRDQPGLAATTDQAIASGRPLAVSANETFRHIHAYLRPYPFQSLQQSMENSVPAVLQMQQDWAPVEFVRKFEGLLADFSLLPAKWKNIRGPLKVADVSTQKKSILVVSHKGQQCGIHQYGVNIVAALAKSSHYHFEHSLCSSPEELHSAIQTTNPAAVIYNYYEATMPWLTSAITRSYTMPSLGIMHEVTQDDADAATCEIFDFHLCPDPTLEEHNPFVFRTKRLIPHFLSMQPEPPIPVIGSFGFGFGNKGFHKLVLQVQEEYDEAVIRLHMPFNDIVDPQGQYHALETAKHCQAAIKKPGIRLIVNHNFLEKKQLLEFLASNSINCFFYDTDRKRGISSVIEHALAAERPIAITSCGMFRHIVNATPSICIENSSLKQIHANGIAPLVPFYNEWSEASFIVNYEQILDKVLSYKIIRIPVEKIVKDNGPKTPLIESKEIDSQPTIRTSILESEDLIEQGRYSEAREILQEILRADSTHVDALIDLSVIENRERKHYEALKLLNRASAIDPGNEIVQGNIAYLQTLLQPEELITCDILEEENDDAKKKPNHILSFEMNSQVVRDNPQYLHQQDHICANKENGKQEMRPISNVQIELAGRCSAECEFCDWVRRPKEQMIMMDTELAKKCVREARALGAKQISFHVTGESLLHPDILDILPRDYPIIISTNCLQLEGPLARELAKMENLIIILAVLWSEPEKKRLTSIMNATAFLQMNPRNRMIVLQMICSESAVSWASFMYNYFSPYLDKLPGLQLHLKQPYTQEPEHPTLGYIPVGIPESARVQVDRMPTPQSCGPDCVAFSPNPSTDILIQSDGQIKPCFKRWPHWNLGNAKNTSLRDAWTSKRFAEIRSIWSRGDAHGQLACHDCIRMAVPRGKPVWWGPGGPNMPPSALDNEQSLRSNDPNPYPKLYDVDEVSVLC